MQNAEYRMQNIECRKFGKSKIIAEQKKLNMTNNSLLCIIYNHTFGLWYRGIGV